MSAPFFSIVVPCRNAENTLSSTIESIVRQTETDWEIIIVDGASTDTTLKILEQWRSKITALVSEPDHGVYDAMNKATARTHGQWLLFLGADDRLSDDMVLARVRAHMKDAETLIWCGEARYTDGRIWHPPTAPRIAYRNFMHHQACIYHRSIFQNQRYDLAFPIQADYDLNLRLWKAEIRPTPIPVLVTICGSGGLSDGGRWANYRDEIAIRHRHFPAWRCLFWDLLSLGRYFRKKIVRSHAMKRPE